MTSPDVPASVPTVALDPLGTDHHGEAARLRSLGPIVRVILPGGISAWAVTHHEQLADLVTDPRVSKDWRNWTTVKNGQLPEGWPLDGMVRVTNMVTRDGAEHRRLRSLVTSTLTPRRVKNLRPRITGIVDTLLDALPACAGPDGTVDLRPSFAYPVPMQVICELTGVPEEWRRRLRELVDSIFRTNTTPEEVRRTQQDRLRMLQDLVDLRTRQPGTDLTSTLIASRRSGPTALTDEELIDTLWLLVTAGHETTLSLILNSVRALLTHPGQRALAISENRWDDVIEETMRWDAPIGNFLARYPTEDIEIAGVTVPAGDAILACYSAAGRDADRYGDSAGTFDLEAATARHLSFGGGPHFCPGAGLARAEASIAVSRLFTRYPGLALAVPASGIKPVPSLISNSAAALPVRLNATQPHSGPEGR